MNKEQLKKLENDLWAAADNKYRQHEDAILAEYQKLKGTRRERSLEDIAVEKCGFALGPQARYNHLLNLPGNWPSAVARISIGTFARVPLSSPLGGFQGIL